MLACAKGECMSAGWHCGKQGRNSSVQYGQGMAVRMWGLAGKPRNHGVMLSEGKVLKGGCYVGLRSRECMKVMFNESGICLSVCVVCLRTRKAMKLMFTLSSK